jgi:hypothetical protein
MKAAVENALKAKYERTYKLEAPDRSDLEIHPEVPAQ